MADPRTFVVVGAGLCGATTVATLRAEGFDGRIVLIGAEELPPYERPPLSKEYLRGEDPLEKIMVRPPEWFAEQDIEARFGTHVTQLDGHAREVVLAGGERVAFDALVVATGGHNRRIEAPGSDLPGVLDLRYVGDAARLRDAVDGGARVACVGMGFIGAEVAASLRTMGCDVTVIEIFETALYRVLGRRRRTRARGDPPRPRRRDALQRPGRAVRGRRPPGARRDAERQGRGGRRRGRGRSGPSPRCTSWPGPGWISRAASRSAPTLETSIPGVFAVGDVARHEHPVFGPMRVEHFDNALKMGEAVARNMLGADAVFDDPHWFWSDQYDVQIQMAGFAPTWDRHGRPGLARGPLVLRVPAGCRRRAALERVDRVAARRPPVVRVDPRAGAARSGRAGGSRGRPPHVGPG